MAFTIVAVTLAVVPPSPPADVGLCSLHRRLLYFGLYFTHICMLSRTFCSAPTPYRFTFLSLRAYMQQRSQWYTSWLTLKTWLHTHSQLPIGADAANARSSLLSYQTLVNSVLSVHFTV